jgi:hypothetical protein
MKTKQISLYIDTNTLDEINHHIENNNLKASEFYREIFKLGFEQKTKQGNYFLSKDYDLEMQYRILLAAEKAAGMSLEDKQKSKEVSENKVLDLLSK